jgi:hypothetical protein
MKTIKYLSLSLLIAASQASAMESTHEILGIEDRLQKAVIDCDRDTLVSHIDAKSAILLKDQKNAQLAANIYAVALVGTSQKLTAALTEHAVPTPNQEFMTLLTRDILKLHGKWSVTDPSTEKHVHTYPIAALEWCLDNGADANGVIQGNQTKTPGFPYKYQQPAATTNTHPLGILLEVQALPCHTKAIVDAYTLFKKRGATLSDEQALKVLEYWQSSPVSLATPRYTDYQMSGRICQTVSCRLHAGSYSAGQCNAFNLIKAAYILLLDKKDLNIKPQTAHAIRSALQNHPSFSNNSIQRYLKPIVQSTWNDPAKNTPSTLTSFLSSAMRLLANRPAPQVQPVAYAYDDLCNLPPYREKTQYFSMD